MNLLAGRVAIVTGAAQGLGLACAARFAAEGAKVALVDVQTDKVASAAAGLGREDAILSYAADLSHDAAARAMIDAVVAKWGGIDILVNSAGGSGVDFTDEIETVTDDVWRHILTSNLDSAFLCCRAAAPHLRKSAHGRILNFSSGSMRGSPLTPRNSQAAKLPYVTAKGAIASLTFQLALDFKPNGVTANALHPGFVLTEPGARASTLFYQLSEADRNAMLRAMPAPPREPADVGWAVTYLASDGAQSVSGYVIELRGKIASTDLQITDAANTPLGRYAYLEARS